jgi:hypothetical protein
MDKGGAGCGFKIPSWEGQGVGFLKIKDKSKCFKLEIKY